MKRTGLLVMYLFSVLLVAAQTNLDSLYAVWKDQGNPDTIRADAYTDYIYEGYFFSRPDTTVLLADDLYRFAQQAGYKKGMADAMELAGYNYFRMGDYPQALASYQQGLEIAESVDYKIGIATILLRTGFIYHDNEDIVRALSYYERSLKIFEEINDLDGIGSVYNEFGSIYRIRNEFEKALDYYQKSININVQLNQENRNATMFSNIGALYLAQEDYPKSLDYYRKALTIYEKSDDKLGIATCLSGMGSVYMDQGSYSEALDYLQRSSHISEQINDAQGLSATLVSMADVYLFQGNYPKAIEYSKRSLDLAESIGDIGNQQYSYYLLYLTYKAMGKPDVALEYHEQMLVMEDSMQTEDAAIRLQQMEFSKKALADSLLQVEKAMKVEMEHQEEVRQKDKNRNIVIAAGLFFLVLAGGFYSRWRYIKKSKAIIEKEKDRSETLLLNILPHAIAEELKEKGEATARDFDMVSILFSDFKGFTEKAEKLSAKELIEEIDHCFKAFDHICEKYGVEKIKTIGDAYMAAGGLPVPSDESVQHTVLAALEMQAFIAERIHHKRSKNEIAFEMRIGIHTGPVVAGIVGVKKFQYDIWGDTVNIASRMESKGETGKVNISQHTYDFIKNDPHFTFEARGKMHVKGKGELEMWFVNKSEK